MRKLIIQLFVVLNLFSLPNLAIAMTVQEEIAEIRAMITMETQKNRELKTLLADKEKEMEDLKQNLKDLEVNIASLKQAHNIQ